MSPTYILSPSFGCKTGWFTELLHTKLQRASEIVLHSSARNPLAHHEAACLIATIALLSCSLLIPYLRRIFGQPKDLISEAYCP